MNNHLRFIFLGDVGGTWGWGGLGTRRQGVGINMCINNHLSFGLYLFRGHGGTWG